MGKLLETFRRTTEPAGRPLPAAGEEVPFIEVGGRGVPMEASPAVLACAPPRAAAGPRLQRLDAPGAEARVTFRPVPAGPAPGRIAPELVAFHRPEHAVSRQYQALADAIAGQLPGRAAPLLLFTAAAPAVGATTVVLNLAIALARRPRRVLVVDAQRDRPAVAERLGLPDSPGMEEVLAGTRSVAEALQETAVEQLAALTAGRGRSGARWTADALRRLVRQLRDQDGLVLLDAPAWDGRPDVLTLAGLCDAVYLIAADGADAAGADLLQALPRQGVPLRGQILTGR